MLTAMFLTPVRFQEDLFLFASAAAEEMHFPVFFTMTANSDTALQLESKFIHEFYSPERAYLLGLHIIDYDFAEAPQRADSFRNSRLLVTAREPLVFLEDPIVVEPEKIILRTGVDTGAPVYVTYIREQACPAWSWHNVV